MSKSHDHESLASQLINSACIVIAGSRVDFIFILSTFIYIFTAGRWYLLYTMLGFFIWQWLQIHLWGTLIIETLFVCHM